MPAKKQKGKIKTAPENSDALPTKFQERFLGFHETQSQRPVLSDHLPPIPSPSDFVGIKIAQKETGWTDDTDKLAERRALFMSRMLPRRSCSG